MKVQVVQLPRLLEPQHLVDRTVVVFDVLRATSSITAALAAGVTEIRVFGSTNDALAAANAFEGRRLLCGEANCLPPAGFDLGNSPGDFAMSKHAGLTMFLSTTNGTRAIVAAKAAPVVLAGCLLNAFAVATQLIRIGRDVTLLCSGTDGERAPEDAIGAGAVIEGIQRQGKCELVGEDATAALAAFKQAMDDLPATLTTTAGGKNIIRAGLRKDIDFAARLDVFTEVGFVTDSPLRIKTCR
jgi:2-phosphosulfolactate phosphatase